MSPTSPGRHTTARHHILSVLVENRAGVLARVSGLFSRRGYNIYSLAVAPTDDERFSRITIVVDVGGTTLEQITKQLFKLINVVKINELDPAEATEMELALATVKADAGSRGEIIEMVNVFGGRVVDVSHDALTISVADDPARVSTSTERMWGRAVVCRPGEVGLIGRPPPGTGRG